MENNKININIVNLSISLEDLFKLKSEQMRSSNIKIDNETQLKLYGLYKVATVGKYNESEKKPVGLFDFKEKYKK